MAQLNLALQHPQPSFSVNCSGPERCHVSKIFSSPTPFSQVQDNGAPAEYRGGQETHNGKRKWETSTLSQAAAVAAARSHLLSSGSCCGKGSRFPINSTSRSCRPPNPTQKDAVSAVPAETMGFCRVAGFHAPLDGAKSRQMQTGIPGFQQTGCQSMPSSFPNFHCETSFHGKKAGSRIEISHATSHLCLPGASWRSDCWESLYLPTAGSGEKPATVPTH